MEDITLIVVELVSYEDSCLSDSITLNEYACAYWGTSIPPNAAYSQYTCLYGCNSGVCNIDNTLNNIDNIPSEDCSSNTDCDIGKFCSKNKCVTCDDSDSNLESDLSDIPLAYRKEIPYFGRDVLTKGLFSGYNRTGQFVSGEDWCSKNKYLIEGKCIIKEDGNSYVRRTMYTCSSGVCLDGTCACNSDNQCSTNQVCQNNICTNAIPTSEICNDGLDNDKDGLVDSDCLIVESKYISDKEVYLVSDENWQNVLKLVPMSIWQEEGILYKYPVLIYHKEGDAFDIDSSLHFLKQYGAEKITFIGNNHPDDLINLFENYELQYIDMTDYLNVWGTNIQTVVLSENNYDVGLMASVYASYINAPLVFEGENVDLTGKNIITIGNTNSQGNQHFTYDELINEYIRLTNTDKLIVVNPLDLEHYVNIHNRDFYTESGGLPLKNIYGKNSMGAPFLAAAKQELIVNVPNPNIILDVHNSNYDIVDTTIELIASKLQNPKYLTIVASPADIPSSRYHVQESFSGISNIENPIYGNLNNDIFADLAVGRIYGITISDTSSYIARDLFYNSLNNPNSYLNLYARYPDDPSIDYLGIYNIEEPQKLLENVPNFNGNFIYQSLSSPDITANDFVGKSFINIFGHGQTSGLQAPTDTNSLRQNSIWLDSPIVIANSCLTCGFEAAVNYDNSANNVLYRPEDLFCVNMLRRGTLIYLGNTVPSSNSFYPAYFYQNLAKGKTIGEIYMNNYNIGEVLPLSNSNNKDRHSVEDIYTTSILLGDPTLVFPNLKESSVPNTVLFVLEDLSNTNELKVTVNIPVRTRINPLYDLYDPLYGYIYGENLNSYLSSISPSTNLEMGFLSTLYSLKGINKKIKSIKSVNILEYKTKLINPYPGLTPWSTLSADNHDLSESFIIEYVNLAGGWDRRLHIVGDKLVDNQYNLYFYYNDYCSYPEICGHFSLNGEPLPTYTYEIIFELEDVE